MCRVYLAAVLLFASVAWGQSNPAVPSSKSTPVTIDFFALDNDKHPYADLKPDDFTVSDNKELRSIVSLKKGSELPLRIGLLIDSSNSQRRSQLYRPVVLAGWNFVSQILKGPDDKAFLEKVAIDPEASEFMGAAQFKGYVLHAEPEGATALFDGLSFACASRMKADDKWPSRRVLIVLSDGDDNQSHHSRDEAIAAALEAGVVIFSLNTADDSSATYVHGPKGESTLEHFAEATGGHSFLHLNRKNIEQAFSAITEALDGMYFVTFVPDDGGKKGLHSIELRPTGKNKIRFRAPKAYYHQ